MGAAEKSVSLGVDQADQMSVLKLPPGCAGQLQLAWVPPAMEQEPGEL